MFWLAVKTLWHAPRRLMLGAAGVAFPVAILAATLLYVNHATQTMTRRALAPAQVEMRALGNSFDANMPEIAKQLARVPKVQRSEPFAAANVVIEAPGIPGKWTTRLVAVNPSYLKNRSWISGDTGKLGGGALFDQGLRNLPGFDKVVSVTVSLPGDAPTLALTVPVAGTLDVRGATPWFAIPYGDVQGDVVNVARTLVIDYSTFQSKVLPVAKQWAATGGLAAVNPGSSDLPAVSLEDHINVDHASYPVDPSKALNWSQTFRRTLERKAAGSVLVADNTEEPLTEAQVDATNAKIMFLLLGIPGAMCAGALGMSASSALSEANRREDALLRLRGATGAQVSRLAAAQAAIAGGFGSVLGLTAGGLGAGAVTHAPVWREGLTGRFASPLVLALLAGAVATGIRLFRLRRSSRVSEVAAERHQLERGWTPAWQRSRLDFIAIAVGLAILGLNVATGGLTSGPVEGSALALSFYVLLAPIALWVGLTLLAVRALLALLRRATNVQRTGPFRSWSGACLRWLARRPARSGAVLMLGALAIAFGTQVLTFAATYRTAKQADDVAAMGSDVRLTPRDPLFKLPRLGPEVAATSAFRLVPARVGSDRKTVLAIDLPSYQATSTVAPRMISGAGPQALSRDPKGVLVAAEIAKTFGVRPGDTLALIAFPDDYENNTPLKLHVVGVFQSFPPTSPPITPPELVVSNAALPRILVAPPDFYLARAAPGLAHSVAAHLRTDFSDRFQVQTASQTLGRGLTALNLDGLGSIEAFGAGLIAAVGVGILGMFMMLERRREFAILRAAGAGTRNVLALPALEGALAVFGAVLIGVPVGLGLGSIAVRILALFFLLPPPLLTIPAGSLATMVALTLVASTLCMGAALVAINRSDPAADLRGP